MTKEENKSSRILNIIIKIIPDILVLGIFLINASLLGFIYDITLPEAPDWPVRLFVFLMGILFTHVKKKII